MRMIVVELGHVSVMIICHIRLTDPIITYLWGWLLLMLLMVGLDMDVLGDK